MRYYSTLQEQYAQFRFKEHCERFKNIHKMLVPMHIHKSAEILYVTRGIIKIRFPSQNEEIVKAGQAALVFPYQPHEYYREDDTEYFRFNFQPTLAKSFFKPRSFLTGETAVFNVDHASILPTIIKMQKREELTEFKIKSFLYSILADFSSQVKLCEKSSDDSVISKALTFMNENKKESLTIGDVAKAVGCCTKTLSRAINNLSGINFSTLLSILRVDEARVLLLESDMTITDIAMQCGFNSDRNFYRQFKNSTGLSPNQYRKSNQFVAAVDLIVL